MWPMSTLRYVHIFYIKKVESCHKGLKKKARTHALGKKNPGTELSGLQNFLHRAKMLKGKAKFMGFTFNSSILSVQLA